METSLRYTTTDLEGLPAIDGVRYEIIDGDLFVSRQDRSERVRRRSLRVATTRREERPAEA